MAVLSSLCHCRFIFLSVELATQRGGFGKSAAIFRKSYIFQTVAKAALKSYILFQNVPLALFAEFWKALHNTDGQAMAWLQRQSFAKPMYDDLWDFK